jgi:UDP-4-amino-4,6-dideoxy-N-acetyl-beta-L-altrosamine transaminase
MTLAILGGSPVRKTFLPYGKQFIDEDDVRAVVDVLHSEWITTGPKVGEFEEAFAAYVGTQYAVSFSSGTAALHGAGFAAGLSPGDEAITTPLTFCATANSVLYQGARPVFADVCPDTLNIDPDQVAKQITSHTKAILPVDYAGHPADLEVILKLAEHHGLTVIEDACHALGAEYKGRRVGSISHMTVFSFHPVKHITTGEGGMVTTDDGELAGRLRMFRNHGIASDARQRQQEGEWYYEMLALGYNYRITDIGCALGISQLRKLDENVARRREIAGRYTAAFRELPGINLPTIRPATNPSWHLYPIRLKLTEFHADRTVIFRSLRAEGIGVNVHYLPVHMHPYYREQFGYRGGDYPVAEDAYERLISLPIFHGMNDQDLEDVIEAITKVIRYYAE